METLQQLILAQFGQWPNWLVLAVSMAGAVAFLLAVFPAVFAFITWVERKTLGRVQNRLGPNRVGPFGLFQPLADGLKLLIKEDTTPDGADKVVYNLAPMLSMMSVLILWAVVPLAPVMTGVDY